MIMKAFTLIEIIMIVVVIGILATISVAGYWQLLDNARQKVCDANLETLAAAIEIYSLEHDALPGSLSMLEPEHIRKAYAKVMEKKGLSYELARVFVKMNEPRLAYAQFLTHANLAKYGAEADVFVCPADTNGPPSYGINGNAAGLRWEDIPEGIPLICDSDNYVVTSGSDLAYRHMRWLTEEIAKGYEKGGYGFEASEDYITDPEYFNIPTD
jgi:Tfp pilus assembly protein PilE